MKKLITLALSVTTVLALAAVAFAQSAAPTINGTLAVTPTKAGTKAKPANGRIQFVFNVNRESNTSLRRIEYTIPPGIKLNGAGFDTCSAAEVNQGGESVCEGGNAQVGTGAATAFLGSGPGASQINFVVKVYVAGPKELTLSLTSPVTNVAFPATINGQQVAFDIPANVQQPVPGLFSYVTSVTADLGGQPGIPASTKKTVTVKKTVKKNGKNTTKKVKKKVNVPFASVVSCPGGQHSGSVTAIPNTGSPLTTSASSTCS